MEASYPEQSFAVSASNAVRAASLRALGWLDGRLPGKKVLLEHMLTRVEYEYAEHLFDHGLEPGEQLPESGATCASASARASMVTRARAIPWPATTVGWTPILTTTGTTSPVWLG